MSFIPKVLIIAGSDSGGGAGIQADIKSTTYFKGYAMTAVTAITAQNTIAVQSIYPLPKQIVIEQINSVTNDLSPDIIKIGMLADEEIIDHISSNISDYEILSEMKINDLENQIEAGIKLLKLGCKNVLIKGGHGNSENINDVLITSNGDEHIYESKKIISKNTHGTGCSLASAIATNLGLGIDIKESIKISIEYVQNGIKNAPDFGSGNGPIRHF